jgi:hypothetical protein
LSLAELRHFLVSGSSEGVVKVWEVPLPEEGQLQPIVLKQPKAEVNVDARITSVASALVFEVIVVETEQCVHSLVRLCAVHLMCALTRLLQIAASKPVRRSPR